MGLIRSAVPSVNRERRAAIQFGQAGRELRGR